MKNKSYLCITILVISIILIFSFIKINNLFSISQNDTTKINHILQTTCENYYSSFDESLNIAKSYNLDITILDKDENVLACTNSNISSSLNLAIKNHDTILNIKVDNEVVGTLIINNPTTTILDNSKQIIMNLLLSNYFICILFSLIYYVYINKHILRPFSKLKDFASRVASGNLDIPLTMDKNNLFGAFTESFDLMRDELKLSKNREAKANQSKKELVASLSHDIKTPVASIKAVSELLMVYADNENTTTKLKTIESKADQIELLINNLFHATLEELEELKVNPSEENSEIIYALIKNADYQNKISDFSIPKIIIKCDKLRLSQVFDNIISNSYKYAKSNISINSNVNQNYLEISFTDTGKGVDKDDLPLLCEKFYRGKNSKNENGSALGLYVSKYFMNKMDGDLSINNVLSDEKIVGFNVTVRIFIY